MGLVHKWRPLDEKADGEGGMIGPPQRRLEPVQQQIYYIRFNRDETCAAVEYKVNAPIKSIARIGQEWVMTPGQAAGRIGRICYGPGVFESASYDGVVSYGTIAVQGIGVKIAAEDYWQL